MSYFFLHIPKTAGTSFRKSYENSFGRDGIAYDYGKNVDETSPEILATYQDSIFTQLDNLRSKSLIAGHMPIYKYAPVFGVKNCFTFMRDPIQRCYSDFQHSKRHQSYTGSLADYLSKHENRNRQSYFLSGIPIESVGFIGITEEYDLSLEMLKSWRSDLAIAPISLNANPEKSSLFYDLSDADMRLLKNANDRDIPLYERAIKQFQQQKQLMISGLPIYRGVIQQFNKHSISGWVASNNPPKVEAVLGEKVVASSLAVEFRPGLAGWGIEREGFVGFTLSCQNIDMTLCDVRIADTQFYLPKT